MSVFRNGDSGAQHSAAAVQQRQQAARTEDKRNGSMTHTNTTTVREVQQRQARR